RRLGPRARRHGLPGRLRGPRRVPQGDEAGGERRGDHLRPRLAVPQHRTAALRPGACPRRRASRARAGGSGPGPRLERRRTSRRVSGGSGVASPRCHLSPFPACGGGVGWGAGGQPGSFRLLRNPAPIPAFPRKRGRGKAGRDSPTPASGGGLGWGQADSPDHSARCGTSPPSRPSHASGGRGKAGRDSPPCPAPPRAREGRRGRISPPAAAPRPPSGLPTQAGEGEKPAETLRNAPLPRGRGRVGVGGRRTARIIPPAAAPRPHPGLPPQAGEGEMPAQTLRNDLPPPRAGEGWGWGRADAIDPTRRLDIARARHARTTPRGRGWGERDWSFAMSDVPVTAEVSNHKLAAVFPDARAARAAADALCRDTGLAKAQVKVVTPGSADVDIRLEPEGGGIWRTILRAHLRLGLAGAALA